MDKSVLFIKQCDCPELHAKKDPHGGTLITHYLGQSGDLKIHISKYGDYWALGKDLIWLPMQYQIQEMIGKSESCFCLFQTEDGWGGEIIQDREHVFYVTTKSPEQVWLAFYFHEKHSKRWDPKEEKWVKK